MPGGYVAHEGLRSVVKIGITSSTKDETDWRWRRNWAAVGLLPVKSLSFASGAGWIDLLAASRTAPRPASTGDVR